MICLAKDKDILRYEAGVFGQDSCGQVLSSGVNGSLSGCVFTASGEDFFGRGVEAGCVVTLTAAAKQGVFEIVSVDSAEQLTISLLRDRSVDAPVAPNMDGIDIVFEIVSYRSFLYAGGVELIDQTGLSDAVMYLDRVMVSQNLRDIIVFAVLSGIYFRLTGTDLNVDHESKSQWYARRTGKLKEKTVMLIDGNGDGIADMRFHLGSGALERV